MENNHLYPFCTFLDLSANILPAHEVRDIERHLKRNNVPIQREGTKLLIFVPSVKSATLLCVWLISVLQENGYASEMVGEKVKRMPEFLH